MGGAGRVEGVEERLALKLAEHIAACETEACLAGKLADLLAVIDVYASSNNAPAGEVLEKMLYHPKVLQEAERKHFTYWSFLREAARHNIVREPYWSMVRRWAKSVMKDAKVGCKDSICRELIIGTVADSLAAELPSAQTIEDVLLKLSNAAKLVFLVCNGDSCWRSYMRGLIRDERVKSILRMKLAYNPGRVRALIRLNERFSILRPFEDELASASSENYRSLRRGKPRVFHTAIAGLLLLIALLILALF